MTGTDEAAGRGLRTRVYVTAVGAAAAGLTLAPGAAHAHAKFFADAGAASAVAAFPIAVMAGIVVAAFSAAIALRLVSGYLHDPTRARCLVRWVCERIRVVEPAASFVPVIARVALGVTLLLAVANGSLLAPHWELEGAAAAPLLMTQAVLGLLLIAGVATRAAAASVPLLLAAAALTFEPVALLERADIIGLSVFVAVLGGKRFAPRLRDWEVLAVQRAAWALRVLVAVGLVVTAFTEKLLAPGITLDVLAAKPMVDLSLVLPIDQLAMVAGMAGIEILFAALVLFLPVAEISLLVVAMPFVMTVTVFGYAEVIGHLPVYGAMLSLLLLSAHAQTYSVVDALSPNRALPARAGRAPIVGQRFPWDGRESRPAAATQAATAVAARAPAPSFAPRIAPVAYALIDAPLEVPAAPQSAPQELAPQVQAAMGGYVPSAHPGPIVPAMHFRPLGELLQALEESSAVYAVPASPSFELRPLRAG